MHRPVISSCIYEMYTCNYNLITICPHGGPHAIHAFMFKPQNMITYKHLKSDIFSV